MSGVESHIHSHTLEREMCAVVVVRDRDGGDL